MAGIIDRASAGMIGVNVGVPVPREPSRSAVGMKASSGGDITGKSSIEFWTKLKNQPPNWNPGSWGELDELK